MGTKVGLERIYKLKLNNFSYLAVMFTMVFKPLPVNALDAELTDDEQMPRFIPLPADEFVGEADEIPPHGEC